MVKKLFMIFIVAFTIPLASNPLAIETQDLENNSKSHAFFDPHNHTNGILTPLELIDPNKFLDGQSPSTHELLNFWQKLLGYFNENPLQYNKGLSIGTRSIFNCNEPSTACGDPNSPECSKSLVQTITDILSATPLTSFATAYLIRRTLPRVPGLLISDPFAKARATIFALAQSKINLVELSETNNPDKLDIYKKIIDDLKKDDIEIENKNYLLKKKLQQLRLDIPQIKWLLTTNTKQLGKISEQVTLSYSSGLCREEALEEALIVPPTSPQDNSFQELKDSLSKIEDVVGVDVAGPETTCFTSAGMEFFKDLAKSTYEAAKARHRKLVVRVHVGEGFPLFTESTFTEQASCEAIKFFPRIQEKENNGNISYVHQREARTNITYILKAIKELKTEYEDIDNYIIFRLGHLTHITKEQAQQMRALKITADANLTSNISTQALPVSQLLIKKYLSDKGINANGVQDLYHTLVEQGAKTEEIFAGHGLKWLLSEGIITMLGSDGGGVEHSSNLADEYRIAEKLIQYWNATDESFKEKNISINTLLKNQKLHFEQMNYHE